METRVLHEKHLPMRILGSRVFRGPHRHSRTPMILVQIDLGDLEYTPTDRLEGFTDALLARLPGLADHGCSYGEPGGFVRRMREGTWIGHVIEHVALELQTVVGMPVTRGKTRSVKGQPGVYNVMFAYVDEDVALKAGWLGVRMVDQLLPTALQGVLGLDDEPLASFDASLDSLRKLAVRRALGPTTASLLHEAARRRIPARRLDDDSLIMFGQGKKQKRVRASCSDLTSQIAADIAANKALTKRLLEAANLPVPKGVTVSSADNAVQAADRLGYPVVTKPLDGNHGRGVTVEIKSAEDVRWGFQAAQEHGRAVIVEQQFTGSDHRILVIGGEVVAVAQRVPAHVVGDGTRTISDLVAEVNRDPKRGKGHCCVLTRIDIDDTALRYLEKSGLNAGSVPAEGKTVFLRPTANLSTGGTAIDRTDEIHPENALIARRAAKIVGLDIAGIDFICPDITRPVRLTGGGIVEVNAGPGFRMHLEPFQGRPRNVARPVLELLFPEGSQGRIPIFAVTGTNGKTTTVRMLAHILQCTGAEVGMTTTTGIYLNGDRIASGDCSGPKSARLVLCEPGVDVAVLECARGGILREGLGFDTCDVGAVLNVSEDHIGFDGVDSIDDLAEVKAVVVESVRRGGWSILNADDPKTAAMSQRAGGSICYYTMKDQKDWPDFLAKHVAGGGRAINRERMGGGWDLVIHEDHEAIYFMKAHDIPATLGGGAEFNVANALAAIAMTHCHRVPLKTIRAAMSSFEASFDQSPGRLNIHDGHGFRTILDYAHNPDGLTALGALVDNIRAEYNCTVGVVGIAGDRRDSDIRDMGRLAARLFDRIIFREDGNLRGREPGTIISLLREGARAAGCAPDRILGAPGESAAVEIGLRLARPGDLLVVLAEDVENTWTQITCFEPGNASVTLLQSTALAAEAM